MPYKGKRKRFLVDRKLYLDPDCNSTRLVILCGAMPCNGKRRQLLVDHKWYLDTDCNSTRLVI